MGKNYNMERMPLKPYQGQYIQVMGNLEERRGENQWLLTDVWHWGGKEEFLTDHVWVNNIYNGVACKMFRYIREESRLNDIYMHEYHWNCAEDHFNPREIAISKNKIDNTYKHKVIVEAKVKCYADYTKYGLGELKEQKVYYVENSELITWDNDNRQLVISICDDYE